MENLKQLQHDYVRYILARDYTPEARLTPELASAMFKVAASIFALIILAAIIF